MADMQIRIGAEVNGAVRGLQQVETQAQRTFQKVNQFSGSSAQTMLNFNRVVQDAPYGFIGIANNLNPLLESFQRLKAETKTTGGAFKELGKSLVGPGGLGIALAAIQAAVLFSQLGFSSWIRKTKESKEATDEYTKSVNSAVASVTQEAAKVETLIAFIKLETTSKKERNNAIKELQTLAPGYFSNLNAEKASIQDITKAYDNYLFSLRKSIEARVIEKELQDTIAKRLELEKKLNVGRPVETAVRNGKVVITAYNAIYDATGEVDQATKELNQTRQKELDLAKQLAILQPPKFKPQDFKEQKVDTNKIINDAKQLAKELEKIGVITPKFSETQTEQQQLKLAKDFIAKFKGAKLDFIVNPKIKFEDIDVPPIAGEQYLTEAEKQAEKDGAILGQAFIEGRNKVLTTGFILTPEALKLRNLEETIAFNKKLGESLGNAFNESFTNALAGGIESVGQGLGNLLTGKNFGQSILDVLSELLSSIGKALVSYGVVKEGLDKLFGVGGFAIPGGVAIALGALAIASSQIVKNFGGAREKGGPVSGNKTYLVGERGPELFVPSVSGSIIPNNQLNSFGGRPAFASSMGGRSMVRGNDILLAYARTQRSQNRVNG